MKTVTLNRPTPDRKGKSREVPACLYKWNHEILGQFRRRHFDQIESFCLFVGYPRSGESLLGSLLDAHPEIMISHEASVLQFSAFDFSREAIYSAVMSNAEQFARKGRSWSHYGYAVQNQSQGKFETIKVMGDKKGPGVSRMVFRNPSLLKDFQEIIKDPIKFIHNVRNPYDIISTMFLRYANLKSGKIREKSGKMLPIKDSLNSFIQHFFMLCEAVLYLKNHTQKSQWYDVRHEDFVLNPERELKNILIYLNRSADDAYLTDCAAIVNKNVNQSRLQIDWSDAQIVEVSTKAARYPFLSGYQYDS